MNHKLFLAYWQKGLYLLFMAVLITGLVVSAKPVQGVFAASNASSDLKPMKVITIEALIDGRSWLILRKNTAQWYHLDFAAPGRHEFVNVPTIINGEEWFPVWPDVPDAENRDCQCYSSIFKGVKPGLHRNKPPVEINVLQGRGTVSIVEHPSKENNNALVIEFDDNPYGGPATYQIEIVFRSGGKP
ncbi:MAG: hypothetical protein EHM33_21470 [Chloroflexi bacterium]|nr:MAG: hypothetical protein EHM33_21470 [Chloroflexota bacterium]